MKNIHFPTLMMVCMAIWLSGTGCDHQEKSTPCNICGVANWTTYSPSSEKFLVLMPIKPTVSTKMIDSPAGQMSATFFTATPLDQHAFVVIHGTYPPATDMTDVEKIFRQIDRSLLTTDAQLISKTNITLQGIYPGREFILVKEDRVVTLRVYLVSREMYEVMCVMPTESNCQTHIHEFLDSFQIKQK